MEKNVCENESTKRIKKTNNMVLTAILFAISLVLSIVENSLPPLLIPVPGVKLGLSNIIVMYALFFLGNGQAFAIVTLKATFVFFIRGLVAGFLSFSGGILSLIIMSLLLFFFKDKISYLIISIFGAVFHNIGQFLAITIIYTDMYILVYLPVLLISGVIAGVITATILKFILPAFKKLGFK